MKENPLISVIIPCYNGEKFISESIESVIAQSYKNWELIVVDDGSTDKSKVLVRLCSGDRRVKLVENECNIGIPKTKNRGLSIARGDYVAFLDQDDVWMPEKIDVQLSVFGEGNEVGVVCTGMIFTDEDMKERNLFNGFDDTDQKELLKALYLNPTNSSSLMMVKRDALSRVGTFDEDIIGWDDYELLMRIATQFRVRYVRKLLVKKRLHSKNAHCLPTVQKQRRAVFEGIVSLHPFLKKYEQTQEAAVLFTESLMLLKEGERGLSRKILKKCMRLKPLYPRNWVLYIISVLPGRFPSKALALISAAVRAVNSMKVSLYYKGAVERP